MGLDLRESINNLRSAVESAAQVIDVNFVIYSEREAQTDTAKTGLVYLDDEKPWQLDPIGKFASFNVVISFAFQLDNIDEVSEFFESNAQSEVYNILLNLIKFPISGTKLVHNSTEFFRDKQERYVGESKFKAVFSEV